MFGLMKNTSSGCSDEKSDWYRLHYCGTCKALGQIYGQSSRLFLNYDLVFLSEFLSLIKQEDTETWSEKLYSSNCFSLPELDQLPKELAFAADVNALFVDLKIKDNIQDNSSMIWTIVQKMFQRPLGRIHSRMSIWGIDYSFLLDLQNEDLIRENSAVVHKNLEELLIWHAEPTAQITGYLFSKGADAINRPELATTFHSLGHAFGKIIYLLDAWKDWEKDQENEEFNPLLRFPQDDLTGVLEATQELIWKKVELFIKAIEEIPLEKSKREMLASRIKLNLAMALGESPKVCSPKSGIEKSSVPQFFKKLNKVGQKIGYWLDPLRPSRFALSYMVLLFIFFHQQLFAIGSDLHQTKEVWDNLLLLAGISAVPPLLFFMAKKVVKNKERWHKKLEKKRKRLLKKMRKAERRAAKDRKKRKWWFWVLVILGGVVVLSIISAFLSNGGGIGCGGSGCGGCNCGDCNCGDGCCSCGDCNCNC